MEATDHTALQRRTRGLLVAHAVLLVASVAVAIGVSRASDWRPLELVGVLFLFALSSELFAVKVRTMQVAATSSARVVAAALLGPAPAVAISLAAAAIDEVRASRPPLAKVANAALAAATPLVVGLLFRLVLANNALEPIDPEFALLIVGAGAIDTLLSWTLVVLGVSVLNRERPFEKLVRELAPVLPLEALLWLLTAGAAYLYSRVGIGALAILAIAITVFQFLVHELVVSEGRRAALQQRAHELAELRDELRERSEAVTELAESRGHLVAQALDAEDRERRRLAEALHDEAVQNLLSARQELEEATRGDNGSIERADVAIQRTVEQLRGAIFDLHPSVLEHAGLEAALSAVAEQQGRLGHFAARIEVDPAATGINDQLLFSLARELITNVAKHARASEVGVRITRADDVIELGVHDDGVGFDEAEWAQARQEGHIGLASTAGRVEAIGGRFALEGGPGAGTRVSIAIPTVPQGPPPGAVVPEPA